MAANGPTRQTIDKEAYRARVPELRELLLEAQFDLRERQTGALLLILAGPDGESKAALGHRLCEWMDMRFIRTEAFEAPGRESAGMPWLWRYWRALPAKGSSGLFYGSWYNDLFLDALDAGQEPLAFEARLRRVNTFERMLSLEGIRILKVGLTPANGAAREDASADREERWQELGYGQPGWDELVATAFRITSTGHAPWVVIDGEDPRTRDLSVAEMVLEVLSQEASGASDEPAASAVFEYGAKTSEAVEPVEPIDPDEYSKKLAKQQKRLDKAVASSGFADRSLLVVMEGVDAAGKGGAIRRITEALDPRRFSVHPYAAPSEHERRYPYLWRFWSHLPTPGHVGIFDRSYYGRVLVERVEGFCTPAEWGRAYGEIRDFEQQLVEGGTIVHKFWLSISKEEQLRRFEDRQTTAWKRHKITDEDWRNREKWDDYQNAMGDMIARTDTPDAPWTVIDSEDKRRARIEVLKTLNRRLKEGT